MKFLHLADLHIGKRVNGFSMIEDQRFILNQIVEIALNKKVEGILIAGDIYDKPIPPAEAVTLLNEFLEMVAKNSIKVFAISGNHDSAERMGFGAGLMSIGGVHISKPFKERSEKIQLEDEWGKVNIFMLPFIKPALVRHCYPEVEIADYNQAMAIVMEKTKVDENERNILVAHQFVRGGSVCDSEEFNVGGVDEVAADHFDKFDYVALGHLHGPQHINRDTVRYAGSPLKYSFSEKKQNKSITLIELKEKGIVEIEKIPLKPLKDMRTIEGTYLEVTAKSFYQGINVEDYIHVVLKDEEDVPEALGKLRTIYPNIMSIEYDNKRTRSYNGITEVVDVESKSPLELFEQLYEMQNNQELSMEQRQLLEELIEKIWKGEA